MSLYIDLQKCRICKELKDQKAYVGSRDVCRLCWYYLPKEEKELNTKTYKYLAYRRKLKIARQTDPRKKSNRQIGEEQ